MSLLRTISELHQAELCPRPLTIPRARLKGSAAMGKTYERKVEKHLARWVKREGVDGELYLGQWIKFRDSVGSGHAQPDAFLVQQELVLLAEIKLTQTLLAEDQMNLLYKPLLQFIFGRPVVCVQICKGLRVDPKEMQVQDLNELLRFPRPGCFTYHWLP